MTGAPEEGFADVNGASLYYDVAGDLDRPAVDVRAKLLSRSIPRAQKVVINGTAHVPSMEKPEEFNRVVLGFLSGVSGAG
jgi:pimeloyl-ACP methyl ester carboxylesterase